MATIRGTVQIDVDTCKGCELCVEACPQDSLAMSDSINGLGYHYAVLVQDNCTGCVNCALVCPDAVITVYRSKKKSTRLTTPSREAIAVISNVQGSFRMSIDDLPERTMGV